MADARIKFAQPDENSPFGCPLKEAARYLNIGVPSFTRTFNATLPEEERWRIQVNIPGRTFAPVTEPIEFTFDVPTWSLGKSMAAHTPWDELEKFTTTTSRILSTRFVGAEMSIGR